MTDHPPLGSISGHPPTAKPHVPPAHAPTVNPLNQEPPAHLRPATASWWASVAHDFPLEPHHLRLLTLACEAWDRGQEAREAIGERGATYVDRFGQPRARPEVAIERDSRISFARLVRELALTPEGVGVSGRPPRIKPGPSAAELMDPDDPFYDIFNPPTRPGQPR